MKNKVKKYLKEEWEKGKEEHKPPASNEFFASSIGRCINQEWLMRKYPKEPQETFLGICKIGNMFHDFIQKEIYPEAESEIRADVEVEGVKIRGRLDILDKKNEKIIELKSASQTRYIESEPKDAHRKQVNVYLHSLKMKKGEVVYISKKDLSIISHEIDYDAKLFEDTIRELKEKKYYIETDIFPGKELERSDAWQCRFCGWQDECIQHKKEE